MQKKYVNIIENDLIKNLSIKRFIFNFLFILITLIYQDFFSQLIYDYLTPKNFLNNYFVSTLFIFLLLLVFIRVSFKVLKNKYNSSTNEINFLILALFLVCFFNYCLTETRWTLEKIKFQFLNVTYIKLIILLLIATLIVIFKRYLIVLGENKKINLKNNLLLDDNPISKKQKDRLDYQETVKNLVEILKNDNHKKSFTIGLVGPWGNGKSSVLNIVKKELLKDKNSDIIFFDFLPYLNHKENDIINEFFTCLSNELKPYNGKLSNIVTEYSSKLTDLYENKNVLGFIENHVTDFKNSSANELYSSIDEMLYDVNKKIIVFVDDLDRLNKNEILQVFKLIRNTADFRNTFFVVAMDKEYVLKSLKKSKKIFHSSFIDKFFQLEIYLPEINKNKLKEIFIDDILSSNLNNGSPLFETYIRDAINSPDNLFNDYIKNIRDVKRTINQIVYDFPYTGGEINFKDFINFTYFKLKFPNFVKIIYQGIGDFLVLNTNGLYELVESKDEDEKTPDTNKRFSKFLSQRRGFNPKKYKLYSDDIFENCLIFDKTLDCENKYLLLKTLAYLFGNENKIDNVDSIKYENNLRILLEQKVYKNRLLNVEFKRLISSDLINIINLVDEFKASNKLEQLLSRFEFFTASKDEEEYKNAILALVYIFEKRRDFSIYEANITDQIGAFAFKLVDSENGLNINIKEWSLKYIFNNEKFNDETKVLLLGHLKNGGLGNKFEISYWGFQKEELKDLALKLFQDYLNNFAVNITDVNDYSLYNVYHTIKIEIQTEVVQKIKEFWKNNIEILCAQITDLDSWTSLSFKISNVINEFFETQINFIQFVKEHKDSTKPQIKEFLELFKLLEISEFKYACMYTFEKSILMLEKIEHQKQFRRGKDENQGLIQLVLETNSKNFIDTVKSNNDLERNYGTRIHIYENNGDVKYYLFVYLKSSLSNNPVKTFVNELYNKSLPYFENWDKTKFMEENIIIGGNFIIQEDNNNYFKIYSIEPIKKSNLNYEIY